MTDIRCDMYECNENRPSGTMFTRNLHRTMTDVPGEVLYAVATSLGVPDRWASILVDGEH